MVQIRKNLLIKAVSMVLITMMILGSLSTTVFADVVDNLSLDNDVYEEMFDDAPEISLDYDEVFEQDSEEVSDDSLGERTALVTGMVTLEGNPIAGVHVYFEGIEPEYDIFVAMTDVFGRFSINLPAFNETRYTAWALFGSAYGAEANSDSVADDFLEFGTSERAVSDFIEFNISFGGTTQLEFELYMMDVSIRSASVVYIYDADDLAEFLRGELGSNTSTFVLMNDINMAGQGLFQGRGHVDDIPFMGVFQGCEEFYDDNNRFPIISGLSLTRRDATEPSSTAGHNDFGFIRVLGHGAIIENVTFSGMAFTDTAALAGWDTVVGNIGLLAGRVAPNSLVLVRNVNVNGAVTFSGARALTNKRVGGLVGTINAGGTLNVTNADVSVTLNLQTSGTAPAGNRVIPVSGGVVGEAIGNVNINGGSIHFNTVNTGGGAAGNARQFHDVGGAVGRITTPAAVASSRIQNITVSGNMFATQALGGVVGRTASIAADSLVIYNVTSGISTTTDSVVAGGFVGIAASATITDSTNNSNLNIGTGTAGGFIGRSITTGVNGVRLSRNTNNGTITANTAVGGFVGEGFAITIENSINNGTVTGTAHRGGFIGISRGVVLVDTITNFGVITPQTTGGAANNGVGGIIGSMHAGSATLNYAVNEVDVHSIIGRLGGLIGRTQGAGAVNINNSENHGSVRITAAGTFATARDRQSSAGGLVGYANGTLNVTDSRNHGDVHVNAQNGAGGIVGITPTRGGSQTILTRVGNYGIISGTASRNRNIGGLIGQSRNPATILDSRNYGNVTLNANNGRGADINSLGGFIGLASNIVTITNGVNRGDVFSTGSTSVGAAGTTTANSGGGQQSIGGFIGRTQHRTTITNATNYGHVYTAITETAWSNASGGIIGRMQWPSRTADRTASLTNVTNRGNVGFTATGTGAANRASNAGGIVGLSNHRAGVRGLNIINVLNTGRIGSRMSGGGIIGYNDTLRTTINGAMNRGEVSHDNNDGTAGGILGRSGRNNVTIRFAGNEGAVFTTGTGTQTGNMTARGVGGIIGNINRGTNILIANSFNAGSLESATVATGGIIGNIRRAGRITIQDAYNIGVVRSRDGTNRGNGILGNRFVRTARVTMVRVFNAGNAHGQPIYGGSGHANRNMTFRSVYFDTTVHTSAAAVAAQPGVRGVPTSVLTSGGLAAFNTNAWRIHGWMAAAIAEEPEMWESYPFLAWQINDAQYEEDFFGRVELSSDAAGEFYAHLGISPGADHRVMTANAVATQIEFFSVRDTTGMARTAWEGVPRDYVRTFNPYLSRTAGSAPGRQHALRPMGDSSINVTRNLNTLMSVGLISPRGVVGFGPNEMFVPFIAFGVDEHTNNLVSWSNMTLNGVNQTSVVSGMLAINEIELGTEIVITALGYHPAVWVADEAEIARMQQASLDRRRFVISVPMERAPIPYLRVELRNASSDASDPPPFIAAGRNPRAELATDPARTGNIYTSLLANTGVTHFNANGAHWHDILSGMADRFGTEHIELTHDMIIFPSGTVSATNPLIVRIGLEDIAVDLNMYVARVTTTTTDEGEAETVTLMSHGGRTQGTAFGNPSIGNRFTVEFMNPPGQPNAQARPQAGTVLTGTAATNVQWETQNLTEQTLVRVVPVDTILTGNGGNMSFRPTEWKQIDEVLEFDDEGVPIRIVVPLQSEYRLTVEAREYITIFGEDVYRPLIPNSRLDWEAEVGLESPENWYLESATGVFTPVRVLDGEVVYASASGFVTENHEVNIEADGTGTRTIYLERLPAGRIYGFVFELEMLTNPTSPPGTISGAMVTVLNSSGNVVAQGPSAANGFFSFAGLSAGTYTVMATHPDWGAYLSVPTPVILTANDEGAVNNARANIFLDGIVENGFMLFIDVRANTANGLNISNDATAMLTYVGGTSPRHSNYASPFLLVNVNPNDLTWMNGELTVSAPGFISRVIPDVGDLLSSNPPFAVPVAVIQVVLTSTVLYNLPVIVHPANNSVTSNNRPPIRVTGDPDADSVWVVIRDYAGVLVEEGAATYYAPDSEWRFTPTNALSDGGYEVYATQTIGAHTSNPSVSVDFTVRTTIQAPVITAPVNNALSSNERQPISGTGRAGYTVFVEIWNDDTIPDATLVHSGTVVVAANGTWTFAPGVDLYVGYAYEAIRFTARARHEVGAPLNLQSAWSNEGSFLFKNAIADPAFDDEFVGTENNPVIVDEIRPNITGEGEPGATITIRIYNGDNTFVGEWEVVVDNDGEWSFVPDVDLGKDKTYRVNIAQEDDLGNESGDVDTWIRVHSVIYRRITGYVLYDGFSEFNQVPVAFVRLYNAADSTFVAQTTASVFVNNGRFELTQVDSALTYYIVIHKRNHTNVIVQNVTFDLAVFNVSGDAADISDINYAFASRFILFAGNMDAIDDGEINTLDWSLLVNSMFQTHVGALAQDLNDDEEINVLDQSLLLNNFLRTNRVVQHNALTLNP